MKRNIIYTLILSVFILVSCSEDFLDTNPTDAISNETALTSYTNIQKATNSLYASFRGSGYYGAAMQIFPEIMADNVTRSAVKGSSRYVEEFNLTLNPSVGYWTGIWTSPYYIIHAANNIINKIESGDFDQEMATEEEIDQLLGEALFVRGLCHFDLCRSFAHHYKIEDASVAPGADGNGGHIGIPIVLVSDIESYPARNTVREVYNRVISDLRKAERLITFDKGKTYASTNAARALLARVYHYQENADSALYFAESVITSGEFPLAEGDDIVNYWVQEDGDETIFQIYVESTEGSPGNSSLNNLFNLGDGYTYCDLTISESFYDEFDAADLRRNLYEVDANGEIRPKKFLPKENATSIYDNNLKILRIAEMYLISAEASYDLGRTQDAIDRMEDLLETRGLTVGNVTKQSILLERRKELACEGHRLFDLARAKANNIRPDNGATPLVNYPSHLYVLPIRIAEMERNENMVQNPGY